MAEDMYPKPSVGRIVHYRENTHCVAAVITQVNADSVDVTLFPSDHAPVPLTDVRIGSAGSAGMVHWPERV